MRAKKMVLFGILVFCALLGAAGLWVILFLDGSDSFEIEMPGPEPDGRAISDIFPDPGLAEGVARHMGLCVTDFVTQADLDEIPRRDVYPFDLSGRGIICFEGIQYLRNLERLWLGENNIQDLSRLAELNHLVQLCLRESQLTSFALDGLPQLRTLFLNGNPLIEIRAEDWLYGLSVLRLSDTAISDISPLAEFPDLLVLHLENLQISDITPLAALTRVDLLRLSGNAIYDISPLLEMERDFSHTSTHRIYLSDNQISEIGPLPVFPPDTRLSIVLDGNPICSENLPISFQDQGELEEIFLLGTEEGTRVTFQFRRSPVTEIHLGWQSRTEGLYDIVLNAGDTLEVWAQVFPPVPGRTFAGIRVMPLSAI